MEAMSPKAKSKVTSKGQVVIPKNIRTKYRIDTSTVINWIEKEQGILMVPVVDEPVLAARGMLKGSGLLRSFLLEKHSERQREDRKWRGKKD
jgi:AbrB family looped-hinge helix DNA binding protein